MIDFIFFSMFSTLRSTQSKFKSILWPKSLYLFERNFCSQNPILEDKIASKIAFVGKVRQDGLTPRFFKSVTTVKIDQGWEIRLDEFALATKAGQRLIIPTEELAMAVATDWDSMHEKIDPNRMPVFNICAIAGDLTKETRKMHENALLLRFEADVLGARVNSTIERELFWRRYHTPIISWFEKEFHLDFKPTAEKQPIKTIRGFQEMISGLDNFALMGMVSATDLTLSPLISFALWNSIIDVNTAEIASRGDAVTYENQFEEIKGKHEVKRSRWMIDLYGALVVMKYSPTKVVNEKYFNDVKIGKITPKL